MSCLAGDGLIDEATVIERDGDWLIQAETGGAFLRSARFTGCESRCGLRTLGDAPAFGAGEEFLEVAAAAFLGDRLLHLLVDLVVVRRLGDVAEDAQRLGEGWVAESAEHECEGWVGAVFIVDEQRIGRDVLHVDDFGGSECRDGGGCLCHGWRRRSSACHALAAARCRTW